MLKLLYPGYYAKSVFTIDYPKLYAMGYRGLIFDIDNTLVPHGEPSVPEVDELFRRIHAIGFQTILLSDNSEARVTSFMENIDGQYICLAGKPHPASFLKAVEMLGMPTEQVLCIGDQVFMDILGANRAGIESILVRFIGYDTIKHIGKRRQAEKVILWFYRHNRRLYDHLGSIEITGGEHGEKET